MYNCLKNDGYTYDDEAYRVYDYFFAGWLKMAY